MFFVTAFLFGIGLLFLAKGIKAGDTSTKAFGASLLIAAIGTAIVTWIAFSRIGM